MAERDDSDREVLTSLPRSRPVRRSAKRGERPATPAVDETSDVKPARQVAARAPRGDRASATGPARAGSSASARVTANDGAKRTAARSTRAKPSASRPAKPTASRPSRPARTTAARAAKTPPPGTPQAAPAPTMGTTNTRERPPVTPRPRRTVPAAGYAAPDARADETPGSAGAELVSTTIQAAAELAQIGLSVGRQTLKSMLDRLPKP